MGKRILYVLLSAMLLSIPWIGGPSLTLFVGFIPLLMLQEERPKRFWLYVMSAFLLWWAITTWWVAIAAVIGIVAAFSIGTALTTSAFMLYDYVLRKSTKPLAYTVFVTAWIGYEYLFTIGDVSFPWLNLGQGFANSVKLVQWYEYSGIFGGTLWVLVVNLLIFNALKQCRSVKKWIAPALAVVVPIIWSLAIYYKYQEPAQTATVTIVQPNFNPYNEKFNTDPAELDRIMGNLIMEAPEDVDAIILPETAIDRVPEGDNINSHPSIMNFRNIIRMKYPNAAVITGASSQRIYLSPEEASATARTSKSGIMYDYFNSAMYIDSTEDVQIHHKSILVVGAEKMPFYKVTKMFDFLTVDLGGITGQLGVDTVRTVFTSANGLTTGTAICYESLYGAYFGEFVKNGAQLMFVITNDGWWGNTTGYRNHFSYSRLRAIETRRSIARSANTGISGFINQRGDVIQKLGWDVRGTITDKVHLNDKITFYVVYGDVIARLSGYILALSILYFISYLFKKKHHMEQ